MAHILFITANSIGDSVLSTGVLALLKRTWPQAAITVVCGPAPAPLFQAMPSVARVITMPKQRYGIHWLKLWGRCIRYPWRLVVDLRSSVISWFLPTLSRRIFFSHISGIEDAHVVTQFSHFMRHSEPIAPWVEIAPSFHAWAKQRFPDHQPVIALGPTASKFGKQWRMENYAELTDRLTRRNGLFPGAWVAVFGGPGDQKEARPVIEAIPTTRRIDLVGRADLAQTYACLMRCCFYIGNDSGLMHMAAAAGIPTLGLFGPTNAKNYHPWGQHTAIAHTDTPCNQHSGSADDHFHNSGNLMYALRVGQVEKAVSELWKRVQPHGENTYG